MAKKKKQTAEQERATAEYYKLHTQAVDDLIHANEANSPQVSRAELAKYQSRRGLSLADWLKMLLIKFWFNGAVCFFFFWGLGIYLSDFLDQMVVLGIAMGVITDLLVNNILRFYAKTPGENDRWMMFPKKGYASFPLNILYSFVILFFVFMLYNLLNAAILAITGAGSDSVPVGVEPILFGLFYLLVDLFFLGLKQVFLRILDDAKKNTR